MIDADDVLANVNFWLKRAKSVREPEKVDIFIQRQNFVLESIKQNRNRILFFLLFTIYALVTVLGVSDRDIFFENHIKFPLLQIKIPLITFNLIVPIFIIAIHFNVLYLLTIHQKLLQKHSKIKNFYTSMPFGMFDLPTLYKGGIYGIIALSTYFLIYILPFFTLITFWFYLLRYQESSYSYVQIAYIVIDFIILSYFLYKKWKGRVAIALLSIVLLCIGVIQWTVDNEKKAIKLFKKLNVIEGSLGFILKYYPHLELSGERLVNFDYEQLKVLQSLEPKKSLALLQTPLDLRGRSFKHANFSNAILVRVNLRDAHLQEANLQRAQLQKANLQNAQLQGANLEEAQLQEANLRWAQLQGANMMQAELQRAALDNAHLENAFLWSVHFEKAILFRTYFQGAYLWQAYLQGAHIREAKLYGANLGIAQLQGADLLKAELQGANLSEAQLQGADLSEAQLQGAILAYAQLQGANLTNAQLQGANLQGTQLQGAYSQKYDHLEFRERIEQRIGKKSDLYGVDKNPLTVQQKEKLIKELMKINPNDKIMKMYLKYALKVIKESNSSDLEIATCNLGSYTKEDAKKFIKGYEEAIKGEDLDNILIFPPSIK